MDSATKYINKKINEAQNELLTATGDARAYLELIIQYWNAHLRFNTVGVGTRAFDEAFNNMTELRLKAENFYSAYVQAKSSQT